MMGHGGARRNLPLGGMIRRIALAYALVFATYNPLGPSLVPFLADDVAPPSVRLSVALALGLAWLIIARVALQGLGLGGVYIYAVFLVCSGVAVSLVVNREPAVGAYLSDQVIQVVVLECVLALFLAFGLAFAYFVRQMTGQSAVVKNPP